MEVGFHDQTDPLGTRSSASVRSWYYSVHNVTRWEAGVVGLNDHLAANRISGLVVFR